MYDYESQKIIFWWWKCMFTSSFFPIVTEKPHLRAVSAFHMCFACKHLPAGNTCWTTAQYDRLYGEENEAEWAHFALQLNMSLHHFSPQTCGRPADEANRKNIVKTYHIKATRQHNRFGSQQLCFFTAARCGPEAPLWIFVHKELQHAHTWVIYSKEA